MVVGTNALAAIVAAVILLAWRRGWSTRKIALISALPVPLVILFLCVMIFIRAALGSKQECGVDACGFAMAGAVMGAMLAFLAYLVGSGIAFLVARARRR